MIDAVEETDVVVCEQVPQSEELRFVFPAQLSSWDNRELLNRKRLEL